MNKNKTYKTNKTYAPNNSRDGNLIPPHGGYRQLASYQMTEIIYDLTVIFCQRFVDKTYKSYKTNNENKNRSYKTYSRMSDQMIQAARSGKQNIAEGSMASGTSKKTELKLVGVARASLEELLQDYEDFLRQNEIELWGKNSQRSLEIRRLGYRKNRSYRTYMTYMEEVESAANCLVCLINQANYLLDRQKTSLEKDFLAKGGFTERLYWKRKERQK